MQTRRRKHPSEWQKTHPWTVSKLDVTNHTGGWCYWHKHNDPRLNLFSYSNLILSPLPLPFLLKGFILLSYKRIHFTILSLVQPFKNTGRWEKKVQLNFNIKVGKKREFKTNYLKILLSLYFSASHSFILYFF